MKRKILLSILILIFILTGCTTNKESEAKDMKNITNITVTINDKDYNATLENNETTQVFLELLPIDLEMSELNGNEKYIYLDQTLPTKSYNPDKIKAGDIMLYGNDCLVIFYKSFNTSYSYTKIGHIDNLSNLDTNNIIVKFKKN